MVVRNAFRRVGLDKKTGGRMYEVRVHTLRKYFTTRLIGTGVPESHVDYMKGHVTDTYNQVQSLGVETLRNAYAAADLRIRAKTRKSLTDQLKELIRAHGKDPDQVLTREALVENAATVVDQEEYQLQTLRRTYRELVHQEIIEAVQR